MSYATRNEYISKMETQLKDWNLKVGSLENKLAHAKTEARVQYQKQLDALKTKEQDLRGKLNELKSASESAWENLKTGVESAWGDLKTAVESAVSEFK